MRAFNLSAYKQRGIVAEFKRTSLSLSVIPSDLRSCVKVEMAVQGSPSLKVLMISVDVKQH